MGNAIIPFKEAAKADATSIIGVVGRKESPGEGMHITPGQPAAYDAKSNSMIERYN